MGLTGADHHQLPLPVLIQIAGKKPGIANQQLLFRRTVLVGIHRNTAQHLITDLSSNHQLTAGIRIQIHVFHLLESGSIAFNCIHQTAGTVTGLGKDQHLQGFF